MEPDRRASRPTLMLADTSDIRALGVAQLRHADDLAAAAAELAAARLPADAFGSIGAAFLTSLNDALTLEARHAEHLVERLVSATSAAGTAAAAYDATEARSAQTISTLGA